MHFYSVGFFGCPNFGDELLSASVSLALREGWPGCELSIMTAEATISSGYSGLEADFVSGFAPQPEYLFSVARHLRAAASSDLVVVGGGGLLADRYSWASLLRYAVDAAWAVAFGRKFVLVGIGAIDIRRSWLRPVACFLASFAAAVGCRDEDSARRVARWGRRDDVVVGPDLAHILVPRLLSRTPPQAIAVVNVREDPPVDGQDLEALCGGLLEHVDAVVLLAAEPPELAYLTRLAAGWDDEIRSRTRISLPQSLSEAMEIIETARIVIAERFHVNLVAVHANRRLAAILYEEKVENLSSQLGDGRVACRIDQLGADLADRAAALPEPDWAALSERWSAEAASALHRVVERGLSAPPPGIRDRLGALLLALAILGLTVLRTPLVLLKRLLLGRGDVSRLRERWRSR